MVAKADPGTRGGRGRWLSMFKASLGYRVTSRTAWLKTNKTTPAARELAWRALRGEKAAVPRTYRSFLSWFHFCI